MRHYKKKVYKIRPYRSYRKKPRKMRVFLIGLLGILVGVVVLGYILPHKGIVPWKPLFIIEGFKGEVTSDKVKRKQPKGVMPLSGYMTAPETDYKLHREQVKVKGIYVSGNRAGSDKFDELIELCKRTEINAMVIDIKGDQGYLTFSVDNNIIKQAGIIPKSVPIQDINLLIAKLRENNIYPIGRIVTFKDNIIKNTHPEYMVTKKDGSFYQSNEPGNQKATWLNPYNKNVWEYILNIAKEAAAVGFEEIQFDYIRFHEGMYEGEIDFGYESASKRKSQIISEFTKYIVEQLHKEDVYVSADVFGAIITSQFDADTVGQDYIEMSRYLDFICPMVYPSHYADGSFGVENPDLDPYQVLLGSMLASTNKLKEIEETEHRAVVRPWLQDFTAAWMRNHQVYGPEQIRDQIGGVYDAGLEEWLLWNASNRYTEGGLLEQ
ncbi:MAG TPA: putative glycoside hydrolase [Epulopiscium sp.]|nr:putative glycoside hydrolase [Candidatus Epulonipiscium sp.]